MEKKIGDIMSKSVRIIGPDALCTEAATLMKEKHIRHLPVVALNTGKLLGLISDRDLKKYMSPFAESQNATEREKATLSIRVDKIMIKEVITAKNTDLVKNVAERMLQKKIGCVPVLGDEGKLVGIVTTSDFLRLLLNYL